MALQTSGAISLNDIHVEAGGTSGTAATINDSDIRGLISKASGATMSFSEWYGASSYTSPSIPTGAISSLTAYANGSGALRIDDGVTSTTIHQRLYTVQGSWSRNVNFDTEAGRDLVLTFIIKDRDSADIDRFYINNRNTLDLTFTSANLVLTTISGSLGSPTKTTQTTVYETTTSYPTFATNAVLFDNIAGDAGEIYQCSIKFTNIQSGHFSASPDLMFFHEDNEDDSSYTRTWHINLT